LLEAAGFEVTYVGVDSAGCVDPQAVIDRIRADTILITIMHANNEVGTIQPIAEVAEAARRRAVVFHTDAAQSCGKIETRVDQLDVDLLTVAGHKLYAPQGIGALYVRKGIEIEPLHHGAGQQGGRRAGTEPVAAIVGLGAAAQVAARHLNDPRTKLLRDRLHTGLTKDLGDEVVLLGHAEQRLPNTLAVGFRHRFGADILAACPEICASTGAACHSGRRERSDVLAAMNVAEEIAFGMIRFSVGRFTTEMEIDGAIKQIVGAVRKLEPVRVSPVA
jgi:cysteine desulfurase